MDSDDSSTESRQYERQGTWMSQKVDTWQRRRAERPKTMFHEFVAEVFGTATLVMFGNGVVASKQMQTTYADGPVDTFGADQFINMGWGLAVTFGVLASFESSGAHLNPAVTLSNMIFHDMSVKRGLVYMAAQLLGAFLGALLVAINYVAFKGPDALDNFFCTAPFKGVSTPNAFLQEVIATGLLLAGIFAIGSGNPPVDKFHVAGFVGLLVFAIGTCFGAQTGYAINPARDLGPRLVWALFYSAYGLPDLYKTVFMGGYWLVPIFAPLVGGPLGALLYQTCNHPERQPEIAPPTNRHLHEQKPSNDQAA